MKKLLSLTALSLVLALNTTTKAQISQLPWNSGTITSAANLQGWTISDQNASITAAGLRLERPSGEGGFITSPELQVDDILTVSVTHTRGTMGTIQLQTSMDGVNFTTIGTITTQTSFGSIWTPARFIRLVQTAGAGANSWHNITSISISVVTNTAGTTGDLRWRFTRNNEFRIDGVGDMPDYFNFNNTPWSSSWGSWSIRRVVIGDSITSVGNNAFRESGTTSVVFGKNVRRIGISAFQGCSGLQNVTFPDSLRIIDNNAFQGCTGLRAIRLPNNLVTIGNEAFRGCTGPTSLHIPNSVETIGSYAFAEMTNLDYVEIGEGVKSIGSHAFWSNPLLTTLRFNAIDCRTVGTLAFSGGNTTQNHTPIQTFVFGEKVRTIPSGMFAGNTRTMYRVLWQNGQIVEGGNAGTLIIPPTVKTIGEQAFWNTAFTRVEIPATVDTIMGEAFRGMASLFQLRSYRATPPILTGDLVFHGINRGTCVLVVPVGAYNAYANTEQWKDFVHIVDPAFFSAALQSISANGEGVDDFNSGTFTYFMMVPYEVNTITLNAEAVGSGSTISGIGTFDLNVGLNVFVINVTAADGETTLTYTVGVHRQDKTPCEHCGNDPCTCETTTIQDLANDNSITVYPNPVIYELRITNYEWKSSDVIELFDMMGRRVFSAHVGAYCNTPLRSDTFTIDMSSFRSGNYILRIGNQVAKIVKQ